MAILEPAAGGDKPVAKSKARAMPGVVTISVILISLERMWNRRVLCEVVAQSQKEMAQLGVLRTAVCTVLRFTRKGENRCVYEPFLIP